MEEKKNKRKILVKTPYIQEDCIHSFAFFHLIRELCPEDEINVIVDEQNANFFHYLKPLKLKTFSLPHSERSVLKLHRFAANLTDVFNITIYFDLEGTKTSASLGKFFRCEQSYGYAEGLLRYVYTHPVEYKSHLRGGTALVEEFLQSEQEEGEFAFQTSGDLSARSVRGGVAFPVKDILDLPPYLVLFIDGIDDEKVATFWKNFIDSFENRYFVLWRSEKDQLLNEFEQQLDHSRNDIRIVLDDELEKTEQFLINSAGVISNMRWPLILSCYLALDSFYFDFEGETFIRAPHFYSKPHHIEIKDYSSFITDGEQQENITEWFENICKL